MDTVKEEIQAEAAVSGMDAEALFGTIASVCNDYLYVWDIRKNTFWVSRNMGEDFGMDSSCASACIDGWVGKIYARDRERIQKMFREFSASKSEEFTAEYRMCTVRGNYIWVSARARVRRDPDTGSFQIMLGALRSLEQYEGVDPVTGLLKYEFCKKRFENALAAGEIFHAEILLIGIDDFRKINVLNSHSFGDAVLHATARDIQELLPDNMTIYRYESDQFLVFGTDLTRQAMLDSYRSIQQYAAAPHRLEGRLYQFTMSAGAVSYPEDGQTWFGLERGASVALHTAKENGRNRCVAFTAEILHKRSSEQYLSECMAESANNGFRDFRLEFQPVCQVENMKVCGAKVVLRYRLPDDTDAPTGSFMALLEKSGLILRVGYWALEQTIALCKAWTKRVPGFVIGINVSDVQLRDPNFCGQTVQLLQRYGLDAKNLMLELRERAFITEDTVVNDALRFLHERGIRLGMDRFGTGSTALGRLSSLPIDAIKMDKAFVKSLSTDQYNHDFVDFVIRLCHNLEKVVCMEGIDTREELEEIYLLNADYAQGGTSIEPMDSAFFYEHYIAHTQDQKRLDAAIGREKIQRQLAGDKELLFSIMNASPFCMILWGRGCEILSCNREAITLFGAKGKSDFIENFFTRLPPVQEDGGSTGDLISKYLEKTFLSGRSSFRWMHIDPSGEPLPVEMISLRLPYQDGYIAVSFIRDLRAEMKTAQENKQFRTQLQAMLDATPLCLNLWNKKQENTMCNQEAVTLFDLNSEQEYLEKFNELSPPFQPDGRPSDLAARARITEAMEKGRIQFRWMHCKRNGELIPAEITLVRIDDLDVDGSAMVAGYTRDLRAQLKAEQRERAAARRIRAVMDASPLACVLWTMQGEILDCNQVAVNMFEADSSAQLTQNFERFLPRYQPDGELSLVKKVEKFQEVKEKGRCVFEWLYVTSAGEEIPCEVTLARAVIGEEEDIIIAYSRDLRELRRTLALNGRLERRVNSDSLTGCMSRAHFMEVFTGQFEREDRDMPMVFAIFDVDHFKQVNDTYGHGGGDMTLQAVVRKIEELLPQNCFIGRFGGDEFILLLCGTPREEAVQLFQELIRQVSAMLLEHEGESFHISISLGATFQTEGDKEPDDMLRRADDALYQAKKNGRARCVFV